MIRIMNLKRCLLGERELAVPYDGCNWLRGGVAASATYIIRSLTNHKLYVHYTNINTPTSTINSSLYPSKYQMDFFCSRQKIVANLPVTSYFIDNQRYKGCHIAFFIVLSAMPSASPLPQCASSQKRKQRHKGLMTQQQRLNDRPIKA